MDLFPTQNPSPWGVAAQVAYAIQRRGAPIVLRAQTKTPGPNTLLNPPRVQSPTLNGNHPLGAVALSIAAAAASGRLLAGDTVLVGATPLLVTGDASARSNPPGFAAVPVAALAAPLAGGTAVTFKYRADYPTWAMLDTFPARLVDGERIQARDLSVVVSAYQLPPIELTWLVFVNGREMSIASFSPNFERGEIVSYNIQAR